MAYFEQHGAMHGSWLSGRYTPPAPVMRHVCDSCAEHIVPFDRTKPKGRQHWDTGWKWVGRYGAPCSECGEDC